MLEAYNYSNCTKLSKIWKSKQQKEPLIPILSPKYSRVLPTFVMGRHFNLAIKQRTQCGNLVTHPPFNCFEGDPGRCTTLKYARLQCAVRFYCCLAWRIRNFRSFQLIENVLIKISLIVVFWRIFKKSLSTHFHSEMLQCLESEYIGHEIAPEQIILHKADVCTLWVWIRLSVHKGPFPFFLSQTSPASASTWDINSFRQWLPARVLEPGWWDRPEDAGSLLNWKGNLRQKLPSASSHWAESQL